MVYKRFPGKPSLFLHPSNAKLQIGSVVLGAGALVLSPVVPHAVSVAGLAGGPFAATAAPFFYGSCRVRIWNCGWLHHSYWCAGP